VKWLLVDMMECEFIDSAGLAAILRGAKRLDEAAAGFSVACGHPEIRRLLALTAIDSDGRCARFGAGAPPGR